jgi:peptidoglycan/LPS O-acetylase OafA/YrhL
MSGRNDRIPEIAGLRGLAAILIFTLHYLSLAQQESWLLHDFPMLGAVDWLAQVAHAGTDLFFFVSGFLIYRHLMVREPSVQEFLLRRLMRIYPAFLLVLAVYLVLSLAMPHASRLPHEPGAAILYVLENALFLPGLFAIQPIMTVAWSLSYLVLFYLAAPLLVVGLAFRERSPFLRVTVLLAIAAALFAYASWHGGPVRLTAFIAGMLLFELSAVRPVRPGWLGTGALACLVVAMTAIHDLGLPPVLRFILLFVLMPAIGWSLLQSRGMLALVTRNRFLQGLGDMSLSYYLTHGLTLHACIVAGSLLGLNDLLPHSLTWIALPPVFALTVLVARAMYVHVEQRLWFGSLKAATAR